MERQKFTKMMDLSERMYLQSGGTEGQASEIGAIDMTIKSAGEKKEGGKGGATPSFHTITK